MLGDVAYAFLPLLIKGVLIILIAPPTYLSLTYSRREGKVTEQIMKLVRLGNYMRPCQVRRSNACIIDLPPSPAMCPSKRVPGGVIIFDPTMTL